MLLRERSTQYRAPSTEKRRRRPKQRAGKKIRNRVTLEKCAADLLGTRYSVLTSIDRLQFFPGLEPYGLARRNRDLGPGAGVASNAGLARTHIEYAKSA